VTDCESLCIALCILLFLCVLCDLCGHFPFSENWHRTVTTMITMNWPQRAQRKKNCDVRRIVGRRPSQRFIPLCSLRSLRPISFR
jgi:hypothetical protein